MASLDSNLPTQQNVQHNFLIGLSLAVILDFYYAHVKGVVVLKISR